MLSKICADLNCVNAELNHMVAGLNCMDAVSNHMGVESKKKEPTRTVSNSVSN